MRRRRTPYRVIQHHHISYKPEIKVPMFRSEHRIATWLDRLKKSKCSIHLLTRIEEFWRLKVNSKNYYSHDEMHQMYEENQQKKAARRRKKE